MWLWLLLACGPRPHELEGDWNGLFEADGDGWADVTLQVASDDGVALSGTFVATAGGSSLLDGELVGERADTDVSFTLTSVYMPDSAQTWTVEVDGTWDGDAIYGTFTCTSTEVSFDDETTLDCLQSRTGTFEVTR